jgi:hypothetical protein
MMRADGGDERLVRDHLKLNARWGRATEADDGRIEQSCLQ